jgi:hypothetical protein
MSQRVAVGDETPIRMFARICPDAEDTIQIQTGRTNQEIADVWCLGHPERLALPRVAER